VHGDNGIELFKRLIQQQLRLYPRMGIEAMAASSHAHSPARWLCCVTMVNPATKTRAGTKLLEGTCYRKVAGGQVVEAKRVMHIVGSVRQQWAMWSRLTSGKCLYVK
jgi:hypothetical protein